MSECNFTTLIQETECIGDSLEKINNNFVNLDEGLCSLSGVTANISVSGDPGELRYIGINTTQPQYTVDVIGDVRITGDLIQSPFVTFTNASATFVTINNINYRVLQFLTNGTITVTKTVGLLADVLVVGGGGGGGARYYSGGGGGGQVIETALTIPQGTHQVVVGAGGIGGWSDYVFGQNGFPSSFLSLIAMGGGGGGSYASERTMGGRAGASSGGNAGYDGIPPYEALFGNHGGRGTGNRGGGYGYGGGGGGGAGGPGSEGQWNGGEGGLGRASTITGSQRFFGAGGGGGGGNWSGYIGGVGGSGIGGTGSQWGTPHPNRNAVANTGSGGGGSSHVLTGGNGSSGIVIIRYPVTL